MDVVVRGGFSLWRTGITYEGDVGEWRLLLAAYAGLLLGAGGFRVGFGSRSFGWQRAFDGILLLVCR